MDHVLENGKKVSNTHYYRLRRKAKQLGCKMCEIKDTRGTHKNHVKGNAHYRFNENKITTEGYRILIVGIGHPMEIGNGYCYEHRIVMSNHLGRYLLSNLVVHHKDENKLNNDISNLELTSQADHMRKHDYPRLNGKFISTKIDKVKLIPEDLTVRQFPQ